MAVGPAPTNIGDVNPRATVATAVFIEQLVVGQVVADIAEHLVALFR